MIQSNYNSDFEETIASRKIATPTIITTITTIMTKKISIKITLLIILMVVIIIKKITILTLFINIINFIDLEAPQLKFQIEAKE